MQDKLVQKVLDCRQTFFQARIYLGFQIAQTKSVRFFFFFSCSLLIPPSPFSWGRVLLETLLPSAIGRFAITSGCEQGPWSYVDVTAARFCSVVVIGTCYASEERALQCWDALTPVWKLCRQWWPPHSASSPVPAKKLQPVRLDVALVLATKLHLCWSKTITATDLDFFILSKRGFCGRTLPSVFTLSEGRRCFTLFLKRRY